MNVGILGSGLMGGKLGTIFARAGHQVAFSYSRSDRKLERLAREVTGVPRWRISGDGSRSGNEWCHSL
jgi:predicted dinucleotide-binding enzyme